MVATISRDELKRKIDQRDLFLLVETLPAAAYHHAHLPGAINLPPDQVTQLAPTLLLIRRLTLWSTVLSLLEMLPRTLPVNWPRWDTQTCAITQKVSKTGSMQDCLPRANINIEDQKWK